MKIREKKDSKSHFDFQTIQKWAKEIVLGLAFLHSNQIIHRDIKPANLFLKENSVKIGDFGEAVHKSNVTNVMMSRCGTTAYMSPEMFKIYDRNVSITGKTDVWSAGIIIYELITLRMPIPKPDFNSGVPDDLKQIVNS